MANIPTYLPGQVKPLCNIVKEAPDNIAHEKILFNVVVML